jgi:hypothetical protein
MGRGIVDGKMPKRKTGVVSNWSSKGRQITYQIGKSFNKMQEDHLYKKHMIEEKERFRGKYPAYSNGHLQSMAEMVTEKLFLSHFWHIARELEEKSTRGIYADVIMGHTGIIAPYYYEPRI